MDLIALAELANQYGLLIVVVLVVLVNAKAILGGIGKVIGKIYPPWAERQRDEQEWRQERSGRSYTDAITALQSLLEDARSEIKASAQERRILQAYLLKHVAQYEQLAAQTIAAIQNASSALCEQNERIAELTKALRRENGTHA